MAGIKFSMGDSSQLNNVPLEEGQLLFTKDKTYVELYMDYADGNSTVRKKLDADPGVTITWEAYQQLSYAEKHNGKVYYIVDKPVTPIPVSLEWGAF